MNPNIQEIEAAVAQLTAEQLVVFRTWFLEFEAQRWDQQLENDISTGRLDSLAVEALNDYRAGHPTVLAGIR